MSQPTNRTVHHTVDIVKDDIERIEKAAETTSFLLRVIVVLTVFNFIFTVLLEWGRPNATNIVIVAAILLLADFLKGFFRRKGKERKTS